LVVVILIVAVSTLSNRQDNELDVSPLEAATLELDSGASIEIPFGAIFEETTLSVTEVEPPEGDGSVPGSVYDFSAGDVELFEPVKLKIPYDAPDYVTPDELGAIRWLEDLEAWEVLGGDVDTDSKTVEVEVDHLSLFSVFWDTEDDNSGTSGPQVEPVIVSFEPRSSLRTDYVLVDQEFEMYYSFKNIAEEVFHGTLVLELSFPENSEMSTKRFTYIDYTVRKSFLGFEQVYSCFSTDLDFITVKGQERGDLVMQLDVIFQNDNGEELGRDSEQYSILIVDRPPLDSVVEVDDNLYRVSSDYDSEGRLSYEVEDSDTGDKVEDTSIRDKAVYTAWKQESIRLFNAGSYELTSWVSAVPKIGAHLGGSVAWLFGKTGSLSIAVITGGFWGLGVEIGKDALIGVIKQIGDHPEAYTEEVAIDLIDEWYARTSKWTDTKVNVANGQELSFHDALEMHNDLNFNIIYGPPARNSLNAIWNEDLSSWSSDTVKVGTIELAEDVTELPVGNIIYLADVVSVLLELNDNVMDYPPYALLVNQSADNKEHYYAEYYDNLEMLGIEDMSPFALEVFEASLPAGEGDVEPIPYDCSLFYEFPEEMARIQTNLVVDKETVRIGDTLKVFAEWEYLGPLTPVPGWVFVEISGPVDGKRTWVMSLYAWGSNKEKCIEIGDKYQLEASWDLTSIHSGEYVLPGRYEITAHIRSRLPEDVPGGGAWAYQGWSSVYVTIEGSEYTSTITEPEYTTVIAAGEYHTVGLKSNGTVVATGFNIDGQCEVGGWTDIVQVAAGFGHTVGLKSNGTVVATGLNIDGQCEVGGWMDIVQVATSYSHTVGLTSDGTVVAVGDNYHGQCDVAGWTDIIQIAAGDCHTVGLKSDGKVVAVGPTGVINNFGQCEVGGWMDVVQVAAGFGHTVGLKSNGTLVAVGPKGPDEMFALGQCDVDSWTDIIQVTAGEEHTIGIKSDGTVVAVGGNHWGQCDVDSWMDIAQVTADEYHTVGLKSDGTMVAAGGNQWGQCDVDSWDLN